MAEGEGVDCATDRAGQFASRVSYIRQLDVTYGNQFAAH